MENSMRGTGLGAVSLESDENVAPAKRRLVRYECNLGHRTVVPYFVDADEIPWEWTCRCGQIATTSDVEPEASAPVKVGRSHWDIVRERRTIAELERLLAERLSILREATNSRLPQTA